MTHNQSNNSFTIDLTAVDGWSANTHWFHDSRPAWTTSRPASHCTSHASTNTVNRVFTTPSIRTKKSHVISIWLIMRKSDWWRPFALPTVSCLGPLADAFTTSLLESLLMARLSQRASLNGLDHWTLKRGGPLDFCWNHVYSDLISCVPLDKYVEPRSCNNRALLVPPPPRDSKYCHFDSRIFRNPCRLGAVYRTTYLAWRGVEVPLGYRHPGWHHSKEWCRNQI